jgi:[NiFe] hydrogenase diaphorase moiety large subunit
MAYLGELCALGETMQVASKCGLGQSSPNAFLSVVEHFHDEIMGRAQASG